MFLAIRFSRILRRDGGDASANAVRPEYNPSLNKNATRSLETGCIPKCSQTFPCPGQRHSLSHLAINSQSEVAPPPAPIDISTSYPTAGPPLMGALVLAPPPGPSRAFADLLILFLATPK